MSNNNYKTAVEIIKAAILQSQYEALKSVNEKQLMLYYAIGKYISQNTRNGNWGEGAIDSISERLDKEMPGLRGFSARNLRYMRAFYEEWRILEHIPNSNLENASAKIELLDLNNTIYKISNEFSIESFLGISFSIHSLIISRIKNLKDRVFYINESFKNHYSYRELKMHIAQCDHLKVGKLPNNFSQTISNKDLAFTAIQSFKDNYILDFINVEELEIRNKEDIDERVFEKGIVNNIKNFILTFGKGFSFIRNQYHLDAFGEDQYIDLLFFNRSLNCLVAVELKKGAFKSAYLGQLSGYLSILDGFEKKPHENPSIGIILCKDMNKAFVDYIIRDYDKPMGVATYKISKDMSDELRKALPDIEDLKRLLESDGEDDA